MALNINNEGEGSLFWSAGIDLTGLKADSAKVVEEFAQLKAKVASLANDVRIAPHLDSSVILKQIGELEVALGKAATIGFDTTELQQKLDQLRFQVAQKTIELPVDLQVKGEGFAALDNETKKYITTLGTLRQRLDEIAAAQLELNTQKDTLPASMFADQASKLSAEGRSLRDAISGLIQTQEQYNAILAASGTAIQEKTTQLERLRAEYTSLSDVEKTASTGTQLSESIVRTEAELSGLTAQVSEVEAAFKRLGEVKAEIAVTPINTEAFTNLTNEATQLQEKLSTIGKGLKIAPIDATAFDEVKAKTEQPIKVVVDASALDNLRSRITALSESLQINPKINTAEALAEAGQIEAALKEATAAGLDTTKLLTELEALKARISKEPVPIPVSFNTVDGFAKLEADVTTFAKQLAISPKVNINDALQQIGKFETALKKAGAAGFDTTKLNQQLTALKNSVAESPVTIPIKLGAADFTQLEQLKVRVAEISDQLRINPRIDTAPILVQIGEIEAALTDATSKGLDTGRLLQQVDALKIKIAENPVVIPVEIDPKNAITSIETLRAKLSLKQQAVIETTDITQAAALNKEIESLEKEISLVSNVGKTGFNNLGEVIEKTTGKANLLSKGFGFLRQAAFILPGIGIAGIFNLIGEAVVALVTQLFKGGDAFNALAEKMKLYNEVSKEANKAAAGQLVDAKVLYDVATNTANAMNVRLNAVKALKLEFPDYFKNISNEAILNGQAQKSYENLTASILASAKATAARSKLVEIENQILDSQFQQQKIKNATLNQQSKTQDRIITVAGGTGSVGGIDLKQSKAEQDAFLQQQADFAIKSENTRQKQLQDQAGFLVKFAGGEQAIAKVVEKTNGVFKPDTKGESELNKLLTERLRLLQQIEALQHSAAESGMLKEESALDAINAKYDKAIENAVKFNNEVNKAGLASKVGNISISGIEQLRATELNNTRLKQEADDYIKNLAIQKEAFVKFQDATKQIGIDSSRQMFAEQTKGFDSYVAYLKDQQQKIASRLVFNPLLPTAPAGNIGDVTKFRAITKEIAEAQRANKEQQDKNFVDLLISAASYEDRRKVLEEKYLDDVNNLNARQTTLTKEQYDKTSAFLKTKLANDLQALAAAVVRQGPLYTRLGADLVTFTAKGIHEEIGTLERELAADTTLTPQMQADIKSRIDALKSLLDQTDATTVKARQTADAIGTVGQGLSQIAGEFSSINKPLSDTLGVLGAMTSQMSGVLKSMNDLNSGKFLGEDGSVKDMAGQIQAITNIATSLIQIGLNIVKGFQGMKQQARDAKTELKDFNAQIAAGEIDVNLLYRERLRSQKDINDLKLEGLKKENDLLEQQRKQSATDFNTTLARLQQEQYVIDKRITHPGGQILGIGNTKVVEDLGSLAGMNFDQLEKLFTEGRLTDSAAKLFQELQKLKQEGVDIDAQLADIADRMNQAVTGTTADAITDTIAQGFENGFTSVEQFAGNSRDIIRKALLEAFKADALEAPIKKLYAKLAADAQSGGGLDQAEITDFQTNFNATIKAALEAQKVLEQATGQQLADLASATSNQNSLAGSIKAQLTEETGTVLAGAFNGQRIATLELVEIQKVAQTKLNGIELHTFNTSEGIKQLLLKFDSYETGAKRLKTELA